MLYFPPTNFGTQYEVALNLDNEDIQRRELPFALPRN